VLKRAVLSRVRRVEGGFLSTRKKTSEKKFSFLLIEQIVINRQPFHQWFFPRISLTFEIVNLVSSIVSSMADKRQPN
jgi:hypothetical protein